jgi:hypothetical protein
MMFKKILVVGLVLTVLIAVAAGVYQNTLAVGAQPETSQAITGQAIGAANRSGQTSLEPQVTTDAVPAAEPVQEAAVVEQTAHTAILTASGDLSQAEAEALAYMVEEEKLARDVYNALYAVWGSSTFTNIAASEQGHIDSIKNLLSVYGIADPSSSQAGVFTNPELQALYTELVAGGSQSLAEALKVGAAIEEIDILDLEEWLTQVDNPDIQQVFGNLLRGSGNHLRAFVKALQAQTGEIYQPQYLTLEQYEAILSETSGNNGNGGGQGGGGNGYRGGQP